MQLTDKAHFFIVYPVGLESLGLIELEEKFALHFPESTFTILEKALGGLEIECELKHGLLLNKILRTPTRLLLRLGEFKCRDAPKLYQKCSKFPWAAWLIGQTPEIECATTNSRLFDSRKIEKAIQDGILQYYIHQPIKKRYLDYLTAHKESKNLPKIYFRAVDDLCTISIDTTGERLHLRGEKLLTGLAPIRENLAALLLLELKQYLSPDREYSLIDPMCGSGTFLVEALNSDNITSERDFSYLHTPISIDQNILHKKMVLPEVKNCFSHFLGFELNAEVVKQASANSAGTPIVIKHADLFHADQVETPSPVVILNPPYGIRVGENINLAFYLRVIESIKKKFAPELLGIIIPSDYLLKPQKSFRILSSRAFKNGGIDVVFYVLEFK